MAITKLPNKEGFFGSYGGQYINENLKTEFNKIAEEFLKLKEDTDFKNEFAYLL